MDLILVYKSIHLNVNIHLSINEIIPFNYQGFFRAT